MRVTTIRRVRRVGRKWKLVSEKEWEVWYPINVRFRFHASSHLTKDKR